MELTQFKRIEDINGTFNSEGAVYAKARVNEMLKSGWVLLEIYKQDYGSPDGPSQAIHYVLGHKDPSAEVPNTNDTF